MPSLTQNLDPLNFEKILLENKLVLVDFFAVWCGPCQMFAPIIEQVATKYEKNVKTIKLDIDENQTISEKYSINSVPTLILFKDGVAVERVSGVVPLNQCINLIDKHL